LEFAPRTFPDSLPEHGGKIRRGNIAGDWGISASCFWRQRQMRLAFSCTVKASRTGMNISRKLTQAAWGLEVSIISFPFALLLVQK
jgi:hypothetical protein